VEFVDSSKDGNSPLSEVAKRTSKASGADTSRELHLYDDLDHDTTAHHHTLGNGPTQAAPGTHGHSNLSPVGHSHTFDDLPEIVIPDEVIVSPTDPSLDGPVDEGTVWIDSSIPDARPQILRAEWELDTFNITSTTFAHPSKWGNPIFVAPCDGTLETEAFVKFDNSGLLNSRRAQWRISVYDSSGTLVPQSRNLIEDDRTRIFFLFNKSIAQVSEGETYRVLLEFALSHANGTTFTVSDALAFLKFLPYSQFSTVTIETDP